MSWGKKVGKYHCSCGKTSSDIGTPADFKASGFTERQLHAILDIIYNTEEETDFIRRFSEHNNLTEEQRDKEIAKQQENALSEICNLLWKPEIEIWHCVYYGRIHFWSENLTWHGEGLPNTFLRPSNQNDRIKGLRVLIVWLKRLFRITRPIS